VKEIDEEEVARTAYHESGHLVGYDSRGLWIDRMEIYENSSAKSFHAPWVDQVIMNQPANGFHSSMEEEILRYIPREMQGLLDGFIGIRSDRKIAEDYLVATVAGPAAEAKYKRNRLQPSFYGPDGPGRNDYEAVQDTLRGIMNLNTLEGLQEAAESDPAELRDLMDAREREAIKKARKFVNDNWHVIQRVAIFLDERIHAFYSGRSTSNIVTGDEIRSVINAARQENQVGDPWEGDPWEVVA
jgi:hypothetical protein